MFSIVATVVYIHTNSVRGFPFPLLLINICYFFCLIDGSLLMRMRWYTIVALICISVKTSDVEDFFIYLLAILYFCLIHSEREEVLTIYQKVGQTVRNPNVKIMATQRIFDIYTSIFYTHRECFYRILWNICRTSVPIMCLTAINPCSLPHSHTPAAILLIPILLQGSASVNIP